MARLFYDDEYSAIDAAITSSDKKHKEVAAYLWPGRKPESAYARLKACLNPDKDERLTFGEIVALCQFCDRYDPLFWMCDELSHDRPVMRTKEDELARLLRQYLDLTRDRERIAPRIDALRSVA